MIVKGRIVDFPERGKIRETKKGFLVVEDGKIKERGEGFPHTGGDIIDYGSFLIMPGFIDVHVHIPQLDARGRYADSLLNWLRKYIFSEEEKFKDCDKARDISKRFFKEVLRNGTTTVMAFSTVHKSATDIAFEEALRSGIRAIIGKTMMDNNSPPSLQEDTETAIRESIELIEKWHGKDNRLFYALTPRFAVTATEKLLRKTAEVAEKYGVYIQTHLAESVDEIKLVSKMFPSYRNYTEVYYKTGILGPKSVMAHSIHLSDDEFKLLSDTNTKVAHCPASNFFLHSGRMNLRKMEEYNIILGLGSDVGAGPYFSMFQLMRDMYYTNLLRPSEAFYYATLGGARVLSLEGTIGTLDVGKEADFIVVDPSNLCDPEETIEEILSQLMFRGDDRNIVATYVRGEKLYSRLS